MTRGYELVGVNEIIAKSDVAKATFYKYFKSKELLCKAWLKAVWKESEDTNSSISLSAATLADKIKLKYKGLEESLTKHSYRGCPFSNTMVMLPDSKPISQIISDYKNYSRKFWQGLASDSDKPDELGDALFLLYSGATAEAQNSKSIWAVTTALNLSLRLTETEF